MQNNHLGNTDVLALDALPFSQACENNQQAILSVLRAVLATCHHVLEIGSGTGQHSVYFAPQLPHLQWQTSDLIDNHAAIQAWHMAYPVCNLHAPLALDLAQQSLPTSLVTDLTYDAVFTANTLHIIAWSLVKNLFKLVGAALSAGGTLVIYGPFNIDGQYTSAGNRQFDRMLRQRDAGSGIRDIEAIVALADSHYLSLSETYQMPANNLLLVFKKQAA